VVSVSHLRATLAPEQWAVILRNLEYARVDNAAVLDRLHVQFGRLAPEHGCCWPGMQRANGWHRPLSAGLCTCGMHWPHVAIEDDAGRYLLG
jgi:hypothetical protein